MMQYAGGKSSPTRSQNRAFPSSSAATQPESSPWRQGLPFPQPPAPPAVPDLRGRHRKRAQINRLNQEIRMLEEELEALEGLPPASKACKELVQFTEACPDPLLPITIVQPNPQWDRWLEQSSVDPEAWCCWK
eukprot:c22101_g2_i1 orf=422-820(-)